LLYNDSVAEVDLQAGSQGIVDRGHGGRIAAALDIVRVSVGRNGYREVCPDGWR
jgi:hypothetical protein